MQWAGPRSRLAAIASLILLLTTAVVGIVAQPAHATTTGGARVPAGGIVRVPSGAPGGSVVVGNLTATDPVGSGFVTVYGCDFPRPGVSTTNFTPGATVANLAVVGTGTSAELCIYASSAVHVIWDAIGVVPGGGSWPAQQRLLDTRNSIGAVPGGAVVRLNSGAVGGSVVMGNVTVTEPVGPGFVTVYSCDGLRPEVSTSNFMAGATVANLAAVRSGGSGELCIYSSTTAHVIWDAIGVLPTGGSWPEQQRLLDTRTSVGAVPSGGVVRLKSGAAGGSVVVGNITATQPGSPGYVTAYSCDAPRPAVSTTNFAAGATVANLALVRTGSSGDVCIYASKAVHVIWDAIGVLPPGGSWPDQKRLLDTRLYTVPVHPATGQPFYPTVARWTPQVYEALLRQGLSPDYAAGVLAQIQQESSGIPDAVNSYDSNWRNGYASFGLMQMIYPTFNTYASPSCRGPMQWLTVKGIPQQYTPSMVDPGCNIDTALRYVVARYGTGLLDTWNRGVNVAY